MNPQFELVSGAIRLRPFTVADTDTVFRLSQEAGMRRWIPTQVYRDRAQARAVLDHLIAHYHDRADPRIEPIVFGVELAPAGELIGHVGLSPVGAEVEIGFAIAAARQGRGYATAAVAAMCGWALTEFRLPRIHGFVAKGNEASKRVLLRAGFIAAGERTMPFQGAVETVDDFVLAGTDGRT
jgi:ribosomal-protein-alanine N-acetyltransferase